ncbi:hypothetical protein MBM_06381 [Drepanopeziza brunnea f. sp. 'multigermtubi' MB_m1]|uniref:Uncharacterized protein n=1 Tax=Marssonina brunnea f. sp. multigermtubi (strain MB_m1) TaxID=1072389 RepID=K1WCU6_MARBU|nr:uncharacterized protein MBM_06381 [Drepanopeziza brunnea f. sp. 'multigermtubi' MB_m1]EKD15165.1 hypothetical protein MBM_06381 [Drepanopeziza brunnea f. sp. 'multigermtubi' MB_m1]
MPSLIDQLGSLTRSIFGVFSSILGSILAVFQAILSTILGVLQSLVAAVGTMLAGLAHTLQGLLRFLVSNILLIGAVVGALFLYSVYQQRNGKSVGQRPAGAKKIN